MFSGKGQFLGLGIFNGLDVEHHVLGVLTPITVVPSIIRFGRIKLDESFREIGFTKAFEP
jgi:polynucleotide 5'-kinase involved in rRNA processing